MVASLTRAALATPLVNGGFESGDFTGWTVAPASVGSNLTIQGSGGADLDVFATRFGAAAGINDTISQSITTAIGNFYQINFFVSNTTGGGENLRVIFGSEILFDGVPPITGSLGAYTPVSFTTTLAATSTSTLFSVGGRDATAFFRVDEFDVTDLGAASAPELNSKNAAVPFIFTCLILLLCRRQRQGPELS